MVLLGVVWCGVVWCGVVWCGVVWCGVVWCGVVWCGVATVCEDSEETVVERTHGGVVGHHQIIDHLTNPTLRLLV